MNKTTIAVLSVYIILHVGFQADAAWMFDTKKFWNSVHGELSCIDCHEAVSSQELHPNPRDVNKSLSDFFDQTQCTGCHEDIIEDLEQGNHGSQTVEDPKKYEYCIHCHDPHYQTLIEEVSTESVSPDLQPLSEEDAACMECHAFVDPSDSKNTEKITTLCFHCHAQTETPAQKTTGTTVPLIHKETYASVPHAGFSCTICHLKAASFPHKDQQLGACQRCHLPHHEKVVHAVHLSVSCEACHLQGVKPLKDSESHQILWKTERRLNQALNVHHMTLQDNNASCKRCHFKGNHIGAASLILPAKSILCMPCHAATFSMGDAATIVALIIFIFGMVMTFSFILTGSIEGRPETGFIHKFLLLTGCGIRTIFSNRIILILKSVFWDVLLQRRLFRQSSKRWLIHSLIFLPFAFRFLWGIIALVASLWAPGWSSGWTMLNQNHPVTAFLFDLTGIMIILGTVLAILRGRRAQVQRASGLPEQDRWALGLIVGIVVIGFVLEGMRIAMTGWPSGSTFAFVGYSISKLFSGRPGLSQWYGYIWYLHAVLTGAFVAYLPFSRLLHIVLAPVVLPIRAVSEQRHE